MLALACHNNWKVIAKLSLLSTLTFQLAINKRAFSFLAEIIILSFFYKNCLDITSHRDFLDPTKQNDTNR